MRTATKNKNKFVLTLMFTIIIILTLVVVVLVAALMKRPAEEIDVDGFVGVKSHRAKGKRLTTYDVATLAFVEPERPERPELSGEGCSE